MKLSDEVRRAIVAQAMKTNNERAGLMGYVVGRATELKCYCGGTLHETRPSPERVQWMVRSIAGEPPRHRKKRIQKKWAKRHAERTAVIARTVALMQAIGTKPGFVCEKCKARQGFYRAVATNMFQIDYRAVATNMFQIEKLPDGALPVYGMDPKVAAIVCDDSAGKADTDA